MARQAPDVAADARRAEVGREPDRVSPVDLPTLTLLCVGGEHQTPGIGHETSEHGIDAESLARDARPISATSDFRSRKVGQVEAVLDDIQTQLAGNDLCPLIGEGPALDGEAVVDPERDLHDRILTASEARTSKNQA